MVNIKFKGQKKKVGNSYMVIIPIGIAQALDPDIEYIFEVSEENGVEDEYTA